MEKSYEVFVEELRQEFIRLTAIKDDEIIFKRKEDTPETDEDRLYLFFPEKDGEKRGCGIYTRELYETSQNGSDLQEIVRTVMERMRNLNALEGNERAIEIKAYEKVRDGLFIRLLNFENNAMELKDAVYDQIGDIALVLYLKIGEHADTIVSTKIRREILEGWGMDKKVVMEKAMLNTVCMSPPRFFAWDRLTENPDYNGEDFMNLHSRYQIHHGRFGNCLSTVNRVNGAVAVFYPGVAEKICQMLGTGFYAVFTSAHEAMIHSDETSGQEELKKILLDTIARATPGGSAPTRLIYHYEKETGSFTWA